MTTTWARPGPLRRGRRAPRSARAAQAASLVRSDSRHQALKRTAELGTPAELGAQLDDHSHFIILLRGSARLAPRPADVGRLSLERGWMARRVAGRRSVFGYPSLRISRVSGCTPS